MRVKSIVKNVNGSLNIIIDEDMSFYDLISEVRQRLNIIISKSTSIPITLIINNHLNDIERIELEETLSRFNIKKFACIN